MSAPAKVLDLMSALKAALLAQPEVVNADVQFRCDVTGPDPFPGSVVCGWCEGQGCSECLGSGKVTVA